MADDMLDNLSTDDKLDDPGKKIIVIMAAGAVLICLLIAAAILIWSSAGTAMLTQEVVLKFTGNETVTDEQLAQTKSVLQERFKEFGSDVAVSTARDEQDNAFVRIRYSYLPYDYVVSLATIPGVFEMRVQTQDNQSEHVLFGDDVGNVSGPLEMPRVSGTTTWGASIELTPSGARKFQNACVEAGATSDPMSHQIMMSLDGNTFHSAPLSTELASKVNTTPPDYLMLMAGTGDAGKAAAEKLVAVLESGTLPVPLEVVGKTQ
jgi:preprotein translocase subunit SecD